MPALDAVQKCTYKFVINKGSCSVVTRITWRRKNAEDHFRKHHVAFEDAARVFGDPFRETDQSRIENNEYRWHTIGEVGGVVLFVAHTWKEEGHDEIIEIISARKANTKERRRYRNG